MYVPAARNFTDGRRLHTVAYVRDRDQDRQNWSPDRDRYRDLHHCSSSSVFYFRTVNTIKEYDKSKEI